jgi:predicted permease
MNLLRKLRALFRKEKLDAEMSEEMRTHLELQAEQNIARGMPPEEARYAARRQFGGVEQIKEVAREQRSGIWLDQFGQDLRHTLRSLRKAPGFTATVVVTLAVGFGLATMQFSFINSALWNGPASERQLRGIVSLTETNTHGEDGYPIPARGYVEWKRAQKSFTESAAFDRIDVTVAADDIYPREYRGAAVEAGIFPLLKAQPFLGRQILPSDERPDAPTVLLLSYAVWQRDFFGDRAVLERTVRLNGERVSIIGVMPEGFRFPANQELWTNLHLTPLAARDGSVQVVGRLAASSTPIAAAAEFDGVTRSTREASDPAALVNRAGARVGRFSDTTIGQGTKVLLLTLLVMVFGVVALGAINVANLLAARAIGRRADIALRAALGATRGRLVRQALVEGLVFAVLGVAGGLLLANWGNALLNQRLASDSMLPAWFTLQMDGLVVAVSFGVALAVGLFCSLVPTLRFTRIDLAAKLKDAGGPASGLAVGRFHRALVVAQIALSGALLVPTGMLVKGIERSSKFAVPYDPARVLTARIAFSSAPADRAARDQFRRELLGRLRALPGIESVALSDRDPVTNGLGSPVEVDGVTSSDPKTAPWGIREAISPDYFQVLHTPLKEGRAFAETDEPNGEPVAIVNESLARRLWPNQPAIGRLIRGNWFGARTETWRTVIGVVRDLPMGGAWSTRSPAGYYVPISQDGGAKETLLASGRGDPALLVKPVLESVRALAPDLPVNAVQTVAVSVQAQLSAPRAIGGLALLFGTCALGLAGVGIHGLAAHAVHRRTREFGIRIALGATRQSVLALVLRGGANQLAWGLIGGGLLGWGLGIPLGNMLSRRVVAGGPEIYGLVGAVVVVAVALALWLPARRAAKLDPMVALRAE